jgi:hypothetical protein
MNEFLHPGTGRSLLVARAAILREIVGNPFREVAVDPAWLSWRDGTVARMAQSIYERRAFEELPILADALEEAGCHEESILRHLRGRERCPTCFGAGSVNMGLADAICDQCMDSVYVPEGGYWKGNGWVPLRDPHVRGCWALDLLLGKP